MDQKIRQIELSDAKAVRDIYAPFISDNATSFEVDVPDVPAMENRIRDLVDQYPWLVFEAGGELLGYAYASSHRTRKAYQWCVEVSVYIHDKARHCGIGRALYLSLFEVLRRQGYVNAYAGITLPNPASVGLHEALGFTPVGVYPRAGFKFGNWHDVIWLELRLLEAPEPIGDPTPAREILRDATFDGLFRRFAETARLHRS